MMFGEEVLDRFLAKWPTFSPVFCLGWDNDLSSILLLVHCCFVQPLKATRRVLKSALVKMLPMLCDIYSYVNSSVPIQLF